DLGTASKDRLVEYQLHRNDWFVRHARRLLQERAAAGDDMSAVHANLRDIFERNPDVTRKLRALWALYVTGGTDPEWLTGLLKHQNEHVRAWAVRLLVDDAHRGVAKLAPSVGTSDHEPKVSATFATTDAAVFVIEQFAKLAASENSWLVHMEVASAVRRLPIETRLDIAASFARRPAADPNVERMIWYAVAPAVVADPQRALAFAAAASPRLRQWTARRLTEHSPGSIALLFAAAEQSTRPVVIADLLQGFIAALDSVDRKSISDVVRASVMRLMDHADEHVRMAALTVGAAIGDDAAVQRIRQVLHDTDQPEETRLAALTGLANRKPKGLADDLRRLITGGQLTIPALRASGGVNDVAVLQTILARYPELSSEERRTAVDVFVGRVENAELLLSAIERKHIPASDISAAQARQIAALKSKSLLKRLEAAWGTVRRSSADRLKRVKELEESLTPDSLSKADLASGRELFRKTCSGCHRLFGDGRTIGPELTGANRRNLHYLISNIVDPSAAVPADFRQATVITVNGRVITGAVSQRTDAAVVIQTANGEVRLRSDEVDELTISPQSMMPDGLLDKLTEEQTRDLVAWLMSDGVVTEH
ncbi:MAG: c-type cytochrome, partial [Planctomycetota bacterium]